MATKKQAKTGKKQAKKPAKPKAKADRAEEEPDELALMIEMLACPVATSDRLAAVCVDTLERLDGDLAGVAAARLVWAEDRTQPELAAAASALHEEMDRHARAMIELLGQLEPLADMGENHPDLDPPEVIERLKPIFTAAQSEG